ncbi:ParB/RepB/Spo0J family partition protein [Virgibacillus sp. DJP39]|uniref:ParB/RepB/Spo0J family partition protein n=1 Tax=Virgibacillus sp. DJP39 TaxID=3409790 RepID=UPI003BB6B474
MEITNIKLTEIIANPNQPRKNFDDQALQELSDSIKIDGLMAPITVRIMQHDTMGYEIVQGERRYRASKIAGLTEIPAFIQELTDEDAFHLSVIENIQREQLTALEEARAFQSYVELGYKHGQITEKVSKSRTYITSRLRLLKLLPEIQDMIAEGKLTGGHAIQILKLQNDLPGKRDNEKPFEYAQEILVAEYEGVDKVSVSEVKQAGEKIKQGFIIAILDVFNKVCKKLKSLDLCDETGIDITDIKKSHLESAAEYEIKMMNPGEKKSEVYEKYEAIEEEILNSSYDELMDKWVDGLLKLREESIKKSMETLRQTQIDLVKSYRDAAELNTSGQKQELKDKADYIEKMTFEDFNDYILESFLPKSVT